MVLEDGEIQTFCIFKDIFGHLVIHPNQEENICLRRRLISMHKSTFQIGISRLIFY